MEDEVINSTWAWSSNFYFRYVSRNAMFKMWWLLQQYYNKVSSAAGQCAVKANSGFMKKDVLSSDLTWIENVHLVFFSFTRIFCRFSIGVTFYLCADALYLGILAASLTISFFPKGITRKVQCQYDGHSTGFVSIIKSNCEGVLLIFSSLMNLIQQDLSPHSTIPFFFIGFVRLDDSFWFLLKTGR